MLKTSNYYPTRKQMHRIILTELYHNSKNIMAKVSNVALWELPKKKPIR